MYDEVDVVDGELSWRRRLCRDGDISDSEELLWYRRRFDDIDVLLLLANVSANRRACTCNNSIIANHDYPVH